MEAAIKKLGELVKNSGRILVTSHISPDPDALASLLLMATTLRANYPAKKVLASMEELSGDLEYLNGYKDIGMTPLGECLERFRPDLVIIVDTMNFSRCSRGDSQAIQQWIKDSGAAVAIIDHHEPIGVGDNQCYINQKSPAAVQDVYEVCFEHLGLKKPAGYGVTTLTGLYADTGGFIYDNPRHTATFKIVNELLDSGISLETVVNKLKKYSLIFMATLAELSKNLSRYDDCSYSFLSDEFTSRIDGVAMFDDVRSAIGLFVNEFIRNIDDRRWGFVVYQDIKGGDKLYSASFRAVSDTKDVAAIAQRLGGGGHKPAAGAKFEAASVEEALEKVKAAISSP